MNIPETSYGMGEFLSDDGRVVTGFLSRSESRFPLPAGAGVGTFRICLAAWRADT